MGDMEILITMEVEMEVITSYYTDCGTMKQVNQDSFALKVVHTKMGRVVFAIICDGMGGLMLGELASKEVVVAFSNWFMDTLIAKIQYERVTEKHIAMQWKQLVCFTNEKIRSNADEKKLQMGTTMTALLIFQGKYYLCHVGDSRAYKVEKKLKQLTEDHTLVAMEMRMGRLSEEDLEKDSRKNVLLQCIGATKEVEPQMICGVLKRRATFVLCSDGLNHWISAEEILQYFQPKKLKDKLQVASACKQISQLAMQRGETDNITVIGIVVI